MHRAYCHLRVAALTRCRRIAGRLLLPLGLIGIVLSGCELSNDAGRAVGATFDFNIHMQTFRQNHRLREVYVEMGHPEYLAQAPNKTTDATAIIQMLTAAHVGKAAALSMAYAWGLDNMT